MGFWPEILDKNQRKPFVFKVSNRCPYYNWLVDSPYDSSSFHNVNSSICFNYPFLENSICKWRDFMHFSSRIHQLIHQLKEYLNWYYVKIKIWLLFGLIQFTENTVHMYFAKLPNPNLFPTKLSSLYTCIDHSS